MVVLYMSCDDARLDLRRCQCQYIQCLFGLQESYSCIACHHKGRQERELCLIRVVSSFHLLSHVEQLLRLPRTAVKTRHLNKKNIHHVHVNVWWQFWGAEIESALYSSCYNLMLYLDLYYICNVFFP